MNLFQDIWVFVAGGGLLVSSLLWFYFLYQVRQLEGFEEDNAFAEESIGPVGRSLPPTSTQPVPTFAPQRVNPQPAVSLPVPAAGAASVPATKAPPDIKTGQTITGGISPAVVYLQNLKNQLEHLDKEVESLKQHVSDFAQRHDAQYTSLLSRLGELKDEVHAQIQTQHQAPVSAQPQREVAAAPAPQAAEPPVYVLPSEPTPVVQAAPQAEQTVIIPVQAVQEKTVPPEESPLPRIDLIPEPAPQGPAAQPPADASAQPADGQQQTGETQPPRRRGPVWPV